MSADASTAISPISSEDASHKPSAEHPAEVRVDFPTIVILPPAAGSASTLANCGGTGICSVSSFCGIFSSRYRQSVIGYGWAVVKPVLSMVIFTFFALVAGIKSDGVPYPIFSFAALLPWMYFSGAVGAVTTSVVNSRPLLTKVYFPRLILPLANAVVGLAELAVQFVVLALLMAWYRIVPGWQVALVPIFVLMCVDRITRLRIVAYGRERQVQGHRSTRAVFGSNLVLALPHYLPEQPDPGKMADDLRSQPDGRHHRGLPLVDPGHRCPRLDDDVGLFRRRNRISSGRPVLLPQN